MVGSKPIKASVFYLSYLLAFLFPLSFHIGRNFEYEYTILFNIFLSLLLPLICIECPQKYLPIDPAKTWSKATLITLVTVGVGPGLILVLGLLTFSLDLCLCSSKGFVFWYMVNCLPTWMIIHAISYYFLEKRRSNKSRRKQLYLFFSGYVLYLISLALILWTNPQKRITSMLLGFLHGPIYDHEIVIDQSILIYRAFTAVFGLLLLWGSTLPHRKWRQGAVYCSIFLLAISWMWSIRQTSLVNTQAGLNQKMLILEDHPDYSIRFISPSDSTPSGLIAARSIAKQLEFHLGELKNALKLSSYPKVIVYLYPNDHLKKLWFGANGTDVTDVYTPSVHITLSFGIHPSLRHELVHALSSDIAFHGLGFHPNMALTEGLAVALAPSPRSLSLHQATAMMWSQKKLPPIESLMSPTFWLNSGARSYTAAGSLVQFMLDQYGIEAVLNIYEGSQFKTKNSLDLSNVLAMWTNFLASQVQNNQLSAEYQFRYSGLFSDLCPHSKADRWSTNSEDPFIDLRRPHDWTPRNHYWPWAYQLEPNNPLHHYRFTLQSIALDYRQRNSLTIKQVREWKQKIKSSIHNPAQTIEDIKFTLLNIDLEQIFLNIDHSNSLRQLKEDAQKKHYGALLNRAISARLALNQLSLSRNEFEMWTKYLAGIETIPNIKLKKDQWILAYLKLLRKASIWHSNNPLSQNKQDRLNLEFKMIYELFKDFDLVSLNLPKAMIERWHLAIANALFRTGDFELASKHFLKASHHSFGEQKKLYAQNQRLANWLRSQRTQ